jgi:sulfatase maturation enzyme AslB (radical SAM superfamily)
MTHVLATPNQWLTDSGLTDEGRTARKTYSQHVNFLGSLPVPEFKVSRAMHLLQSNSYDTLPEGYALPPHTINFSLNNRCNLKCSYCDLNRETEHWEDKNTKASYSVIDPRTKHELPLDNGVITYGIKFIY